jgi:hypothetical protein
MSGRREHNPSIPHNPHLLAFADLILDLRLKSSRRIARIAIDKKRDGR